MKARWLAAIAVLLVARAAPAIADQPDAEQLFEAAADKVGDGKIEEAAAQLERVASEFPDSREAPEALFLAGELYEDRLDDPMAAIRSYRSITERYPDSRVAVAAGRRLATLDSMVDGDPEEAVRLAKFLALRRQAAELGSTEALSRAEALLAEAPDWSNGDRLRVWMGGVALRDGQPARAEALYREAMDAEDVDIRYEATMAAAALARDRNDFAEARRLIESVDPAGVPGRVEALREARDRIETAALRARVYIAAFAVLFLVPLIYLALLGWETRSPRRALRALWPPPIETIYMLPIGAMFIVASFTGHHGIAVAVIMVVIAGVGLSWLSGASLRPAKPSRWRPPLHAALAGAAVLAACYIVLHHNRLLDLIASTVRFGPDV